MARKAKGRKVAALSAAYAAAVTAPAPDRSEATSMPVGGIASPYSNKEGVPRRLGPRGEIRKVRVTRRDRHGGYGVSEQYRKFVYERPATRSGLKP